MDPAEYDAWYETSRGSWIGDTEYRLLRRMLAPLPNETLMDVGCGTGYFTRRFAREGVVVSGTDPDPRMLAFAHAHSAAGEPYVLSDARSLPFRDGAFDLCVSVTALCFIRDESKALAEMLRVTRRRIAIGLLNRRGLLSITKRRGGGRAAYRGAHRHTAAEAKALVSATGSRGIAVATAVFIPTGGTCARLIEGWLLNALQLGAFLVVAAGGANADIAPPRMGTQHGSRCRKIPKPPFANCNSRPLSDFAKIP